MDDEDEDDDDVVAWMLKLEHGLHYCYFSMLHSQKIDLEVEAPPLLYDCSIEMKMVMIAFQAFYLQYFRQYSRRKLQQQHSSMASSEVNCYNLLFDFHINEKEKEIYQRE